MATLEIHLLGPPAASCEGEPVFITRRKARALLFRLAVDLQPVCRDRLSDLLWSDVSDVTARRNLTHLLTHLREALPDPGLLQSTTDFVFLNPTAVWSDTHTLLTLFRSPHACSDTTELLEEALRLYRGPLLDGFTVDDCPEFESWLTVERSIWERRHLSLLKTLMQRYRSGGDLMSSMTSARRALSLDPLDADMHRQLVEMHLAAGEADLVDAVCSRCRDLLQAVGSGEE
jgi:DNA-binding SARP family transcriptional activator